MRSLTILLLCLLALVLPACQKELHNPGQIAGVSSLQLHFPVSALILMQPGSADTFLDFTWSVEADGENQATYTLEAGLKGSHFADAVELVSTGQLNARLTIQEFNQLMRKLMVTVSTQMVEFRLKLNRMPSTIIYSNSLVLPVTTYQPFTEYPESSILRVPGNYENWSIPSAPRIVSTAANGEYEGYINFTDPASQFWLVRGTQWENIKTYNATGQNTFGYNGDFFFPPAGAGVYQLRANTNTGTWSCSKINSWGIKGSAVSADADTDANMVPDATSLTWRISVNLQKGSLVFRANKSNAIVFGFNAKTEAGIPEYNGEPIKIPKAGNYTIVLSLQSAGNYIFSIQKNP